MAQEPPTSGRAASLESITVADGTATNSYVPMCSQTMNANSSRPLESQMIYPATTLGLAKGDKIKSISFYVGPSQNYTSSQNLNRLNQTAPDVTISLGETTATTISNIDAVTANKKLTTSVWSGTVQSSSTTVTFTFTKPYTYNGGNLIVDVNRNSQTTNAQSVPWYGVSATQGSSYYYYRNANNSSPQSFLPKMTVEFLPYLKVDPTALDFGEVRVGATSEQNVTVTNGSDEDAVLRFSSSKFSSTTTSIPAGETVEVPVTFAPGNTAGEQTGTLTITAGDKSVKVDLRGFGLAPYAATIDPQTVDFGDCSINKAHTATVTLTNIGSEAINPTFTQPANSSIFTVTGETGALAKGETQTYTITFTPTEILEEPYTGEFTIADAEHSLSYRVTLSGKGADMALETNSPLNFGLVDLGGSKTLSAEFTNPYNVEITVSLSTDAPFSLADNVTTLTIPAGGTGTVSVTFAPPADGGAISYTGVLTATGTNVKTDVVLRGAGKDDGSIAIRDRAFFEGISYTWKENGEGAEHTNNLAEIATDPDQIIAMLREIYMNKEIPGNYKRGFDANGGNEENNDVSYAGVGTIDGNHSYADTYGWNIPAYADDIYNTSG